MRFLGVLRTSKKLVRNEKRFSLYYDVSINFIPETFCSHLEHCDSDAVQLARYPGTIHRQREFCCPVVFVL